MLKALGENNAVSKNNLIQQKLNLRSSWCIVIDNLSAETVKVLISDLFFSENIETSGILIVTTQEDCSHESNFIDMSHGLSLKEATTLYKKERQDFKNCDTEEDVEKLTTTLDRLPLAIKIAASYLKIQNNAKQLSNKVFHISNYIQLLNDPVFMKKRDSTIETKSLTAPREEKKLKTQEKVIELSLRKALGLETETPNTVLLKLLCFCAYMANNSIPQTLLMNYLYKKSHSINTNENIMNFENLIDRARNYSIIQVENNMSADNRPTLHLHQETQRLLRNVFLPMLDGMPSNEIPTTATLDGQLTIFFKNENQNDLFALMPHLLAWQMHFFEKIKNGITTYPHELTMNRDIISACRLLDITCSENKFELKSNDMFKQALDSVVDTDDKITLNMNVSSDSITCCKETIFHLLSFGNEFSEQEMLEILESDEESDCKP